MKLVPDPPLTDLKKLVLLILLLVPAASGFAGDDLNCFAVVAGKGCTVDGSVLFAHNEDDGGICRLLHWKVDRKCNPEGSIITLVGGGALPEAQETFGYLWSQIPGLKYSDAYLNDHGVALASDACASRENKPDLKRGGIGFMLRRIVAQRARTARHGVKIATALLQEFGYEASGRTLIIADPTEAWILCMVKGKHYAAARVPDGRVIVIANSYPLHRVDPEDRNNFVLSPDLVEYARKRGWYDPARDGPFDFACAYARKKERTNVNNYRRQCRGIRLISGKQVEEKSWLPTFIKPKKKLTPADLMAVLRDHYEGTEYDSTDGYRVGSPHYSGQRTICTGSTRNAIVFQLRADLPVEIGALMWIAMRRPDGSIFMPWYLGIRDVPPGFSPGNPALAITDHFSEKYRMAEQPANYKVFADLNGRLDLDYGGLFPAVKEVRDRFEESFFTVQGEVERTANLLIKKDRSAAVDFLTAYTFGQTARAVMATRRLLKTLNSGTVKK